MSQQQKQPFQEWVSIEKSLSNPNAFQWSDEDSCEAIAEERESVAVELDERNAHEYNKQQRWDYFPSKDSVDDDGFEHIEHYSSSYFEENACRTKERATQFLKLRNQSLNDRLDYVSNDNFALP